MVVSDHGMTESGNHGGSSYEETDSLALFIGLDSNFPSYALSNHNTVFQVINCEHSFLILHFLSYIFIFC